MNKGLALMLGGALLVLAGAIAFSLMEPETPKVHLPASPSAQPAVPVALSAPHEPAAPAVAPAPVAAAPAPLPTPAPAPAPAAAMPALAPVQRDYVVSAPPPAAESRPAPPPAVAQQEEEFEDEPPAPVAPALAPRPGVDVRDRHIQLRDMGAAVGRQRQLPSGLR